MVVFQFFRETHVIGPAGKGSPCCIHAESWTQPARSHGYQGGLRSKLVIVELSIQFWETISSIFKSYQHRSWKMPDNQFNQHSNFQHIPRYSNIFEQTMKTCSFTKRPVSMSAGDWAPAAPPAEGCLWQRVGHSAVNQTASKCLETYENAKVIFLWEHHPEISFFPYFFHGPAGMKHSTFELLIQWNSRLQVDLSPASDGAGP